jgi:hypothetical protein
MKQQLEVNLSDSMHTFDHSKPGICRLLGVAILEWYGATLQGNLQPLELACFISEMNLRKKVSGGRDAYPLFVAK